MERPVSKSDIGRIRNRVSRPAPVWRVMSSAGTAEPVRMNWPGAPRLSTARRMWFQIAGSVCHSSTRRGVSPARTAAGSRSTMARAASSTSRNTALAATASAVAVFPQALGPSTTDCAGGGKPIGEFGVDDSGKVLHATELRALPLAAQGFQQVQGKDRRRFRGRFGEGSGEGSAKTQGKDRRDAVEPDELRWRLRPQTDVRAVSLNPTAHSAGRLPSP